MKKDENSVKEYDLMLYVTVTFCTVNFMLELTAQVWNFQNQVIQLKPDYILQQINCSVIPK